MENNNLNQSQNMNNKTDIPPKKKKRKTKYIVALIILIAGILLVVVGSVLMPMSDFSGYEREDILKDFSEYNDIVEGVSIDSVFSEIKVQKGDNLKVECSNAITEFLDIEYKGDNTLSVNIGVEKSKVWFFNTSVFPVIGFNNSFGEIVITVPEKALKNVKIESVFGSCKVNDINAENLKVENVFGETILSDTSSEQAKIENTFGKMSFENCMINELKAENAFGEIELNKCEILGDSKIEVSFGDIKANLYGDSDNYDYDFDVAFGSGSVNGKKPEHFNNRYGNIKLDVEVAFGDAKFNFSDRVNPQNLTDNLPNSDSDASEDVTDSSGNVIVP